MEKLHENENRAPTPEEVVARINKIIEQWAAEEKAEQAQRKSV